MEADEITTRQDGSLWLLRSAAPPPAKLVPVAVFAARTWVSCIPEGARVLWEVAPASPTPEPVPTTPRFA